MNLGIFNAAERAIKAIPDGKGFTVGYKVKLPLKAESRKAGYKIYKKFNRASRSYMYYNTMKSYDASEKVSTNSSKTQWVVKSKTKCSSNTDTDCLAIRLIRSGGYKNINFKIEPSNDHITAAQLGDLYKDIAIASYFTKSNGLVRNINLDNILYIKYGGEYLYARVDV